MNTKNLFYCSARVALITVAGIVLVGGISCGANATPLEKSAIARVVVDAKEQSEPLSKVEKDKVQNLIAQIAKHLPNWPHAFKEGRENISYSAEIDGVSESDLQAAKNAVRELEGMGTKIFPELILSLNDQKQGSYPTAVVESILFEMQAQPTIITYLSTGKLNAGAIRTVENMLNWEDWRRTWFLPLFSAQSNSAREFAYKALPKTFKYCWEKWEAKDGAQEILDLYIKAARNEKEIALRKEAIDALSEIYEVIVMNEGNFGTDLELPNMVGQGKPGETIGDAGKRVSNWRAKEKTKREGQKEQIAKTFCDLLEHDADAGVRQKCARHLRDCKEAFIEPVMKQASKDASSDVQDECALYFMKNAKVQ